MTKFSELVKGKKILIFGFGLQGGGLGDALWLVGKGATVRVTDKKAASDLSDSLKKLPSQVELSLGSHHDEDIVWADFIIKNPGVPDDQPQITLAHKLGKPVYTSIALVVKEGKDKVIAVTGTRGKSTTTKLIYELLVSLYNNQVELGGNIPGTSGLSILDRLDQLKYLVLELSSFQLHCFHELKVSPHVAVITNMYPDHLNRYQNMDSYLEDKAAITKYQSKHDQVIYNTENSYAVKIAQFSPGDNYPFKASDVPPSWSIKLLGAHNLENIAALISVSKALNINIEQVEKIVNNFHGLPFRLENRGIKGDVTYLNDTTSTTPTSTIKAIRAMTTPTVLIVGGDDKNLPYKEMIQTLKESKMLVKIIILGSKNIPTFTKELHAELGDKIIGQVSSMADAVHLANKISLPGWTVLLSPGFSSFDLFNNEFDRGLQFNEYVDQLE